MILENCVILFSNLVFLLPAYYCFYELKKYIYAFVYTSVFFTSSLYHLCKFGAEDTSDPNGICLFIDFHAYFFLDHLFATLTIPCLAITLTNIDATIYHSLSILKRNSLMKFIDKVEFIKTFPVHLSSILTESKNETTTSSSSSSSNTIFLQSPNRQPQLFKTEYKSLEALFVCIYAYVIGCSLYIYQDPSILFFIYVATSCLLFLLIWNIYYYILYDGLKINFSPFYLFVGLIISTIAVILMALQGTVFPSETYWIVHSIWHINAGIGHYLLLKSKYRYYYYSHDE